MRHWTYWEWVAYAALFVAAMIIAADTGFRISPNLATHLPSFVGDWIWGFAPLGLVVLATIILVMREFGRKPQFVEQKSSVPTTPAVDMVSAALVATEEGQIFGHGTTITGHIGRFARAARVVWPGGLDSHSRQKNKCARPERYPERDEE